MIIAVAGGKGGSGKSMVAVSLAIEYAQNYKTILIDADVECPNDHLLLNIARKKVETIYQIIPEWNFSLCKKCGKCAAVCKQNAIIYVPNKKPAFIPDICIGCKACMNVCPHKAIGESKKEIGAIFKGNYKNLGFITGELKLGQPTSGEVVTSVRKYAENFSKKKKSQMVIIDAPAGIGCPVIASLAGSDYLVAVTEPTPSALHDLKRTVYLGQHFRIPIGIVINKYNLDKTFCEKIKKYAKNENIPILGYIPYHKNFVTAAIRMIPVVELFPKYRPVFKKIINGFFIC
jgi:MinD superfamily P-loop ATPase